MLIMIVVIGGLEVRSIDDIVRMEEPSPLCHGHLLARRTRTLFRTGTLGKLVERYLCGLSPSSSSSSLVGSHPPVHHFFHHTFYKDFVLAYCPTLFVEAVSFFISKYERTTRTSTMAAPAPRKPTLFESIVLGGASCVFAVNFVHPSTCMRASMCVVFVLRDFIILIFCFIMQSRRSRPACKCRAKVWLPFAVTRWPRKVSVASGRALFGLGVSASVHQLHLASWFE